MAKLSVIIPARNETYLIPTVDECFKQAAGEVEVVVVLEGYRPEGWAEVQARYERLHTIYHAEPKGMRPAINAAVASAVSRGTKYLLKLDAHCMLGEGYDRILQADCDRDWIVVPRRLRLDAEAWQVRKDGRPPIDYHYLSFPDNPQDFGGPGLNGKVWAERQKERDKPEFEIDDEMSSQGSCWFMHADYFQRMGFMDDVNYGPFWNEFQELGLSCWLSGGQVKVNKRTWYAHLHKGSNYKGADGRGGRGYRLPESWLTTGATFTKRWLFNEASKLQTRPFKWLIEHFWPVPTWPEDWEQKVYGDKGGGQMSVVLEHDDRTVNQASLTIHSAHYGIPSPTAPNQFAEPPLDVADTLRRKIANGSLDLNVTNADLEVGNPFRGYKKRLVVSYSYVGGEPVEIVKQERDWLIIGQSARYVKGVEPVITIDQDYQGTTKEEPSLRLPPMEMTGIAKDGAIEVRATPAAMNDYLIRKFQIPTHRLRGPMPIEVPTFHRNDLAQLFAELGFNRGAEIGVAEANYSEVLVKANPQLELLCVDPWHRYAGNPQNKTKEKNEYAFSEAKRKLAGYKATLDMRLSMDAVRDVADNSLDFVYIDGHHGFDYVMQDLIEWSKRVRSGGLVSGDDFYYLDPKRWGAGPVEAVLAYTAAHKISPWFIFQGHKSVDFMWVKP